jgi:deazaflavin-dependent oxidoreductase (nitroreductase family)
VAVVDRLARFNRAGPNRVIRPLGGRRLSPVSIVEHRGRASGRRYRTPVLAFRAGGGWVVTLPYGPRRDWVRNVLAAGGGTLVINGHRFALAEPRLLPAAEAGLPAPLRAALRVTRVSHVLRFTAQ